MAINHILLRFFKCFFILILFCIVPVSATDNGDGTGQFESSGSSQNSDDTSDSNQHTGSMYCSAVKFNDVGIASGVSFVSAAVPVAKWGGSSANSYWGLVNYKIGEDIVASGTFGFNKGTDYYYVIAFFNDDTDLTDGGVYSGAQILIMSGDVVNVRTTGSPSTNTPRDETVSAASNLGFLWYTTNQGAIALNSGSITHTTSLQYVFSNTYTYSQSYNLLNFTLDKSTTAQSQVIIENNGGRNILNETSINSVDIEINDFDIENTTWTVNLDNDYGESFSDTINMAYLPPQAEDTIEWGANSYVVDDTGSYSWSLSDSNWDTVVYSKKASIYRDETLVHEVSLPSQTGTFYYTFLEEGSFTVKLRHTSALLPHVTIDSDTVSVTPIGESFISVTNTTVYINTPIGFQFSYGFTPSTAYQTGIEARKLIDGNWIPVNYWDLQSSISGDIIANTLYDYTLGITGHHADSPLSTEGEYMFWLQDADRGDVANTNIYTVEYQAGAPTENITTTYLDITSGESYLMISEIAYNYGIDNTNFSTGTNYFEMYNYDYNQVTQSALLSRQTAYEWGTLYPVGVYEPSESYYWGGLVALPGNNSIRIRHDDLNGSTILVYDNFTLSELNPGGYGLKLSTYEACINDPVTISVTIPAASNVTIYSPYGVEIITYNMNASGTIIYYFPVSGLYTIKLIPNGSIYEEAVASIFISDCADDGIITPPSGEMDDMYINMFNAMTLPAFWGMIIFIGFIGGLAIKRDKNGDALVSGNGLAFIAFGLLNLLSIIGLFAPYTFYIIVSTWIFAGMFFGVGKYLARGEG